MEQHVHAAANEPQPPSDPHAAQNLHNLLGWLQHDAGFEDSVRKQYGNHPKFAFLFGGEGSEYYEAEKRRRGLTSLPPQPQPQPAPQPQPQLLAPYAAAAAQSNGAAPAPAAGAAPTAPTAASAPPAASPASHEQQYTNGQGHPCRDFLRGKCTRGNACKFVHDASSADRAGESRPGSVVCYDFLKGRCNRTRCKFSHEVSGHDTLGGSAQSAGDAAGAGVSGSFDAPICNDYQRGKCFRDRCRYRHVEPDSGRYAASYSAHPEPVAGAQASSSKRERSHDKGKARSRRKRDRSRSRSGSRSKSRKSRSRSRSS